MRGSAVGPPVLGLEFDVPVEPIPPRLVQIVRRKAFATFLVLPVGRADRGHEQGHLGLRRGALPKFVIWGFTDVSPQFEICGVET